MLDIAHVPWSVRWGPLGSGGLCVRSVGALARKRFLCGKRICAAFFISTFVLALTAIILVSMPTYALMMMVTIEAKCIVGTSR